jgi:hypothetical protein
LELFGLIGGPLGLIIGSLDTYAVSEPDRTLNIHVVGSSFPNWNGTDQKRSFVVSADELKLTNPVASTGGITEVVWKRAK